MNTEFIIHPRLQHLGLVTPNIDAMLDWYRKVLGMTVVQRISPSDARKGPPFSATFIANDEAHQRIALFAMPGVEIDPEKRRHARMQHVAFVYDTLDDLLGTYGRLKMLGILPVLCLDEAVHTSFYYNDPDGNVVEINTNNYGDEVTLTDAFKNWPADRPTRMFVDPDKMIAAREAGASPWHVHELAFAGELMPATPYDAMALV